MSFEKQHGRLDPLDLGSNNSKRMKTLNSKPGRKQLEIIPLSSPRMLDNLQIIKKSDLEKP